MELLALFVAAATANAAVVAAFSVIMIICLGFVLFDEYRGGTLEGGWKWFLFLVGLGAFGYSNAALLAAGWGAIAVQYMAAGALVILAKFIEGVFVSRSKMQQQALTLRKTVEQHLTKITAKLQENYNDFIEDRDWINNGFYTTNDNGERVPPNIMQFLFNTMDVKGNGVKLNGPLNTSSYAYKLIEALKPVATMNMQNTVLGSGVMLNDRELDWHLLHYIQQNSDKLMSEDGKALITKWLMDSDIVSELVRQQLAAAYSSSTYRSSNILLDVVLKPTKNAIKDFGNGNPAQGIHALSTTTLAVDFHATRVSGLVVTWFVLWPLYAIDLIFGRVFKFAGDLVVMFLRKFSLGFLNRFLFNNIA